MKKREGYRHLPERKDSKGRLLCLVPTCKKLRVKSKYSKRIRKYCTHHSFHDIFELTSWGSLRRKCLERDNYKCKHCGFKGDTTNLIGDHIIPIALGGDEWDPENVQTLCEWCDRHKTQQDKRDIAKARRREKHGYLKIR